VNPLTLTPLTAALKSLIYFRMVLRYTLRQEHNPKPNSHHHHAQHHNKCVDDLVGARKIGSYGGTREYEEPPYEAICLNPHNFGDLTLNRTLNPNTNPIPYQIFSVNLTDGESYGSVKGSISPTSDPLFEVMLGMDGDEVTAPLTSGD